MPQISTSRSSAWAFSLRSARYARAPADRLDDAQETRQHDLSLAGGSRIDARDGARMRGAGACRAGAGRTRRGGGSTRTGATRAARARPRPGPRCRVAASSAAMRSSARFLAPERLEGRRPATAPPRPPRPSTTSPKCAVTALPLRIERRGERRPVREAHRRGEPRAPRVVLRQVRASAHRPPSAGGSRRGAGTRRHRASAATVAGGSSFAPASRGSAASSDGVCRPGSVPPRMSCCDCTMNSISRMPPGPSLTLSCSSRRSTSRAIMRLHLAQALVHAEVEVASVHEGPHDVVVELRDSARRP